MKSVLAYVRRDDRQTSSRQHQLSRSVLVSRWNPILAENLLISSISLLANPEMATAAPTPISPDLCETRRSFECDRDPSKLRIIRASLECVGALAMPRSKGPYPSSSNTS